MTIKSLLYELWEDKTFNITAGHSEDFHQYSEIRKKFAQQTDTLYKLAKTQEEKDRVENFLNTFSSYLAEYGDIAYAKGFQEGVQLLFELYELGHGKKSVVDWINNRD